MRRACGLGLTLALLPLAAQAGQPALPVQNSLNFTAGAWTGGPVTDDSGRTQACAMFAPAGRMQLFFRLSSGFDFSLGLVYRGWNFAPGAMSPMVYRIDGAAPVEVQARA